MSAEPSPTAPPAPPSTPTTPPPAAWHAGIDAELIGHAQNKGWKIDDPKELSISALKQARELEKHFGVPPEQLLKMPKADAKPEDIKAFWGKLGAPEKPTDYDFSSVKMNGGELDPALLDGLRTTLANAFVPKDKAAAIAAGVAKVLEDAEKATTATNTAKLAEQKTKLADNWKNNYDFNHLKAMEGARRLGLSNSNPDDLAAIQSLEKTFGYARVMEIFRKIGSATSEDTFVERGITGSGMPTTREGAIARKAELEADRDWAGRLLRGGQAELREFRDLDTIINGGQ